MTEKLTNVRLRNLLEKANQEKEIWRERVLLSEKNRKAIALFVSDYREAIKERNTSVDFDYVLNRILERINQPTLK